MRTIFIVLVVALLFIGCESPIEPTNEQSLFNEEVVQSERAPFLLDGNSLAKKTDVYVVIDAAVVDGTVYGSQKSTAVYAAVGGEILPKNTWVANHNSAPVQVTLSSNLVITFNELATVTLMGAVDLIYVDFNGDEVFFTGDGVITTSKIITRGKGLNNGLGKSLDQGTGETILISTAEFGIGGEGGDGS